VLLIIASFTFGFAVVAAIGTYVYGQYLEGAVEKRAEELALAQRSVSQDQVEEFLRLRDRLVYGRDLLSNHTALSQVFTALEAQTLQTVRFETLELEVAEDRSAQLDVEGIARTFNALAAQSNAFAAEKRIRRAIFSDIVVNENNTVSFRLTADLDAGLVTLGDSTFGPRESEPTIEPAAEAPEPAVEPTATTTPEPTL